MTFGRSFVSRYDWGETPPPSETDSPPPPKKAGLSHDKGSPKKQKGRLIPKGRKKK